MHHIIFPQVRIPENDWRHVRYADDFVVLCPSREEAERAQPVVKEVLGKLKLSLHKTKTRLTDCEEGFEFLGFFFHHYRLGIREASIDRFKTRVRSHTRRWQGRNVEAVLADLNPVLRGWANYFGVAQVTGTFRLLDSWVRMRMRGFKYKRRCYHDNWRLPNKRLKRWGCSPCRNAGRDFVSPTLVRRAHESVPWPLATRNPHGVAQCCNSAR